MSEVGNNTFFASPTFILSYTTLHYIQTYNKSSRFVYDIYLFLVCVCQTALPKYSRSFYSLLLRVEIPAFTMYVIYDSKQSISTSQEITSTSNQSSNMTSGVCALLLFKREWVIIRFICLIGLVLALSFIAEYVS
jgi:hypothetical protein